jgi:hypothetical protein
MKLLTVLGVVLILSGVAALVVGEIPITKRETVLQVGETKFEAETADKFVLPPLASIAAIAAGIALVFVGVRKR